MNKASDDLHKLIHSLTASERGAFKKFAQRHSTADKIYLKFFDAIEKQEFYNEQVLKKEFRNLPMLKNYLKEIILQCLWLMQPANDVNHNIDRNMSYARILLAKGLIKPAAKLIEDSIGIAAENALFDKGLLLRGLLAWIEIRRIPLNKKWKFIQDTYTVESNLERLRTYHYRILFEQRKIYFLIEERNTGKPYKHLTKEIDADFLLFREEKNVPFRVMLNRLSTMGAYFDLIDQPEKLYEIFSTSLALVKKEYEKAPDVAMARQYSPVLTNFISVALEQNRLVQAKHALQKLFALNLEHRGLENQKLLRCIEFQQKVAFKEKKFKWGEEQTLLNLSSVSVYNESGTYLLASYNIQKNLALLQFILGKHQASFITIQQFLAVNKRAASIKDELDSLLLIIMVQIEMGNTELLPGLLLTLNRKLKKNTSSSVFKLVVGTLAKYKGDTRFFSIYWPDTTFDYLVYGTLNFRTWLESRAKKIALDKLLTKTVTV